MSSGVLKISENPGGRVLQNLLRHPYKGKLYVVNPKGGVIQDQRAFERAEDLPEVAMAIIAIPAALVPEVVKVLTEEKNTRALIILSAGFGEKDQKGHALEEEIKRQVEKVGATLLGPNNIGVINQALCGGLYLTCANASTRRGSICCRLRELLRSS